MGGGGIIIQRNAVLLTAVTDPSFYGSLSPGEKTEVDIIDGKDPASRTQQDAEHLSCILNDVTCRG